ncbi:hypothetical protein BT63DRAFT_413385 [Microthyrium microscopicum]|uniref:Beta-galactosidase galactose-binding domain-containing protein n=1 Tax=Microthyrium microscopicum TaxID=703497 RepID=A0A6A6UEE7_9PEZI|nr:hypothetical protein BT63DRAFT_413385 [Microthyrium microscopicum]
MEEISFLDEAPKANDFDTKAGSPPVIYQGSFVMEGAEKTNNPALPDTYLEIPKGPRGVVWINVFNLGRYWYVGPQKSLYLPGTLIKPGKENTIVVLELEPGLRNGSMMAFGSVERAWGKNLDINCSNCV